MNARLRNNIDRISFVLLAIILFDCAAFGGGSLVKVFGVDFRMVLYILFVVCSLPLCFLQIKQLLKNKMLWAVLIWGLWFILSTVNGIMNGNRVDLIVSSWIGFASFVILPGALCVLRDKKRIVILMKVMIAGSLVLAVQSLLVLIAYQILPGAAFDELNLFILYGELGGCTVVDEAVIRIFLRSHPLMIASCGFCVYFSVYEKSKNNWKYSISIALCLFSLMLSYTRSVYFGILAAIATLVLFFAIAVGKEARTGFFKVLGKSVAVLVAMILVCDIVCQGFFLSYGIYRTTGINVAEKVSSVLGLESGENTEPLDDSSGGITEPSETTENSESTEPSELTEPSDPTEVTTPQVPLADINQRSDDIREATLQELYEKIAQKPLTGHGVGAMLDVRPEGDNEYFFLDLVFKMGIIGCVLYLLPFLFMVISCLKAISAKQITGRVVSIAWLTGLVGIVAFSWFNPYLNGTNGIVLYCVTMCVFSVKPDEQDGKNAEIPAEV